MQSKASQALLLVLSCLGLLTAASAQTIQPCANAVSLFPAISEYNATSTSVLTLYCAAINPPTDISAYFWQKNSVDLNYPANKYVIGGFVAGDGGVYLCGVQFCGALFYSNAITINTAPSIVEPPSSVSVYEGQTLRLSCAAAGWPTPIISWTAGATGSALAAQAYGSSTYLIQSVASGDGGTYTCTAANELGSVTAVAYVTILALPLATSSTLLSPSSRSETAAIAATSNLNQPHPTTTTTTTTTIAFTPPAIPSSSLYAPITFKPAATSSPQSTPYSLLLTSSTRSTGGTFLPAATSSSQPSILASSSSTTSASSSSTTSASSSLTLPLTTTTSVTALQSAPSHSTTSVYHSVPVPSAAATSGNEGVGIATEVPYAGVSFMLAVAAALFVTFFISTVVALSACVYFGLKRRRQRQNRAAEADKTKLVSDMEGGALHTEKEATDGGLSPADDTMPTTFGHFSGGEDQLDEDSEERNADFEKVNVVSSDELQLIGSNAKASATVAQKSAGTRPSDVQKSAKTAEQKGGSEKRGRPSETQGQTEPSEVRKSRGPSEVRKKATGPSEVRRPTGPSEVHKTGKTSQHRGPSEVRRPTGTSDVQRPSKTTEQRGSQKPGPSEVPKPTEPSDTRRLSKTTGVQKSSASTEQQVQVPGPAGVRKSSVSKEKESSEVASSGVRKSSVSTGRRKSQEAGASGVRKSSTATAQQASEEETAVVRKSSVIVEHHDADADTTVLEVTDLDTLPLVATSDLSTVTIPTGSGKVEPPVNEGDTQNLPTAAATKATAGKRKGLKLNIEQHDKVTLIGADDTEEGGEDAGEVEPSVDEGDADIASTSVFVEKAKKMGRTVDYVKKMSRSHALNVTEMESVLQKTDEAIANNMMSENPIVLEFNSVPVNAFQEEQLPSIVVKNRYSNILPNPYSAVTLVSNRNEGSTYINANYVRGLNGGPEKAFIMTQGPIPGTFADFWRMVWENNVPSVVMLTKLVENGKEKCSRYWPEASSVEPIIYGQYSIRNNFEQSEASYTISFLTISTEQNGISHEKDVVHLWYTAWPDFGVPNECNTILDFYNTASAYLNPAAGPTIVHCSAGVGRSGAFIAVHMGIDEFKRTNTVDPLKYLCSIREDRGGAIQTWEQYLFVHRVLVDYMYRAAS